MCFTHLKKTTNAHKTYNHSRMQQGTYVRLHTDKYIAPSDFNVDVYILACFSFCLGDSRLKVLEQSWSWPHDKCAASRTYHTQRFK